MEKFIAEYEKQLSLAVEKYPEEYGYSVAKVPEVVQRMKVAIANGTFNKEGRAFKNTCKALGIKYTYQAIKEFIAV